MEPHDEQKPAAERPTAECGAVSEQSRGRQGGSAGVRHMGGRVGAHGDLGGHCSVRGGAPPSCRPRKWRQTAPGSEVRAKEAQASGEILAGVSDVCGLLCPSQERRKMLRTAKRAPAPGSFCASPRAWAFPAETWMFGPWAQGAGSRSSCVSARLITRVHFQLFYLI